MKQGWASALATVCGAMGALACSAARADFTVTPAVVSDYDFRGISQTGKDPAAQLGITYDHERSGLYVGVWGSNVDFGSGDPKAEIDASAGWKWGDAAQGFALDFGATYYGYANASELNYAEIYAGIARDWFNAKLYYSPNFANVDESAWYASVGAALPLPLGLVAQLHAGYSGGNYWDAFHGGGYFDWSVGVTRAWGPVVLGVAFVDGSDLADGDDLGCTTQCDFLSTDQRVIATLSTTLPWSAD